MQAKAARGPIVLPLLVAALGVALLLENFLLLGDFRVSALLPLVLVALGAWILIRGDLGTRTARTFGITRGSVQSGTLEISAGEVDVIVGGSARDGRLVEGQFARNSRPSLDVEDTHAHLQFLRSRTPWLSFADWQMRLADDLPWDVLISTSIGQINADLGGLIVQGVTLATGVGDIRLVSPSEAFDPVRVRSAAGDIHVIVPEGQAARVHVKPTRLFRVQVNETRYRVLEPGIYEAIKANDESPRVDIYLRGTFGDAYLS
ncbi:MAG: hypothetical protein IPM16_18295 [Chloroflexi bacterium]|nr:hypothetical protein [Chloroflexota bacterium]